MCSGHAKPIFFLTFYSKVCNSVVESLLHFQRNANVDSYRSRSWVPRRRYQLPIHGTVIFVDKRHYIAIRNKYGAVIGGA